MLHKIIPAVVMLAISSQAVAKPIVLACDTSHENQSRYVKEMTGVCNPNESSHTAKMTLDPSVNNSISKLQIKACWSSEESVWIGKITVGPQYIVFTRTPTSGFGSTDFIIDRASLRAGWTDPMRGFQCKVVETVLNNKI